MDNKKNTEFLKDLSIILKSKYNIRNADERANGIMRMIKAKYHSAKSFQTLIRAQRKDGTFDKFWIQTQTPNQAKGLAAIYEPTEELNEVLERAYIRSKFKLPEEHKNFSIPVQIYESLTWKEKRLLLEPVFEPNPDNPKYSFSFALDEKESNQGSFRKYNRFNMMNQGLRNFTEYTIEYDISAALQTFLVNFNKTLTNPLCIPLTTSYITRKNEMRKAVQGELDIINYPMTAKTLITSLYYGSNEHGELGPIKKLYQHNNLDWENSLINGIKKEAQKLKFLVYKNIDVLPNDFQEMYQNKINNHIKEHGKISTQKKAVIAQFRFLEYNEMKVKELLNPGEIGINVHDAVYFKPEEEPDLTDVLQYFKDQRIFIKRTDHQGYTIEDFRRDQKQKEEMKKLKKELKEMKKCDPLSPKDK